MKEGIIFIDLAGTMVFEGEAHGIEKIANGSGGTVRVRDSIDGTVHEAYDVSTPRESVYFDIETRRLAQELSKTYDIVIVTGARKSTMDRRKGVMDFASGYILEDGGVILGANYTPDEEWSSRVAPQKEALEGVKEYLQSQGWNLDIEGRTASIKIRSKDNPHKSKEEYQELVDTLRLPRQLKKTMNLGHLEIILAGAGKGNAVRYFMEKSGYEQSQSIAIGDDTNDDMLDTTARQFVMGSGNDDVIRRARANGGYVSKGKGFNGINEILRYLLEKRDEQTVLVQYAGN